MRKIFCAVDFVCVFLEHIDEQTTDDLSLGFRVGLSFQLAKKEFRLVRMDYLQVHVITKHAHNFLGFVFTQKPVVDKNTGQLVSDGFVNQRGRNRAVDPA